MGKSDGVSGSFWFLFCLFIIYESYRLGLGTMYQPGPGFLFFWTGIVVAIMALIVVLQSFRAQAAEADLGVGVDCGQDGQEVTLPAAGAGHGGKRYGAHTHGDAP